MKIGNVINKLQTKIKNIKYEQHKKELNLLVNTEGLQKHNKAYNEIALARETIANFAKKNTVHVDIFDTSATLNRAKHVNPELAKSVDDCITIRVTDTLTGKARDAIMPANTKQSYLFTQSNTRMLEDTGAGTEYIYSGQISHEDNFIRTVYRYISTLTEAIKAKKS